MKKCYILCDDDDADETHPNCILFSSHTPDPVHIPLVAPLAVAHGPPRQDQCPTQSSWWPAALGFLAACVGPEGTLLQEPSGERPGHGRRLPTPSRRQPAQQRPQRRVRATHRAQRGRDTHRQPSDRQLLLQLPEGGVGHPGGGSVHHQADARRRLHPGHHLGVEVRRNGRGSAVLHTLHGVHDRVLLRLSAVGAASHRLTLVLLRCRELVAQLEYNVVHWRRGIHGFAYSHHIQD